MRTHLPDNKTIISTFKLNIKEISDDNGNNSVTIFVYEIRTSPTNTNMLKDLL